MRAKLIVEGKEFDIDIFDPKLQELVSPKKTGYERVGGNESYFYVQSDSTVDSYTDNSFDGIGKEDYDVSNYYSDKTVAKNNARADKLMRQLRRFAVEHRENEINWRNAGQYKYYIHYDYNTGSLQTNSYVATCQTLFTIYFDSKSCAQNAINAYRDELIWYFTEYKDSL